MSMDSWKCPHCEQWNDQNNVCCEQCSEREPMSVAAEQIAALKTDLAAARKVLDEIAHPGEVFGEGDYYSGLEAGLVAAAEIASEALEAHKESAT